MRPSIELNIHMHHADNGKERDRFAQTCNFCLLAYVFVCFMSVVLSVQQMSNLL